MATGAVVGIVCVGAGSVGTGSGVGETLSRRSSPWLAGVAMISGVRVGVAGSATATGVGVAGGGVGVAEHAARKRRPTKTIGALKVAVSGVSGVCFIFRAPVPSPYGRALMKTRGDSVGL